MKIYIDHDRGFSVVEAESISDALKDASAEYGRRSIKCVRKATDAEIDWFLAMGGYIFEV